MTASQFRNQSFNQRFRVMGDTAEQKCEEVLTASGVGFERFGFNRPQGISMNKLPPFVRYTPDYVTSDALIEVQGLGRDNTAKFKRDKLSVLWEWDRQMPVHFFLWWSTRRKYLFVSLADVTKAVDNPSMSQLGFFDGRKAAFFLDAEGLGDWRKLSDLNAAA
jgi:hypothetical protein